MVARILGFERTFKIDDYVTTNDFPQWGAGRITKVEGDRIPYRIEFPNGHYVWRSSGFLKLDEAPAA
jgi:hypothetical protein